MLNAARVSKGRTEGAADAQEGVSIEALERLDRLASASVLAAGLAHEIASPLGALLGALDSIERRVRELRRSGAAAARDVDELAEELEIASESTGAITDLVHDFQSFLRLLRPRPTPRRPTCARRSSGRCGSRARGCAPSPTSRSSCSRRRA